MDFPLPELGEGVYEAEAVRWLVKAGEQVKPGQTLLEVLTDKATMEVPAPFAGTITELKVQPGDKLVIGQPILAYEEKAGAGVAPHRETKKPAPAKTSATTVSSKSPNGPPPPAALALIKAAPAVRQMARKLGVDLAKVHGSGPHGRILIDDLAKSIHAVPAAEPGIDYGTGQRVKLQGLRRKIAERMDRSKRIVPHYTYVDECDVTELVALREKERESFAKQGVKLTYLAFFVKATALALKEVPSVNSSLDDVAGEVVLHDHVNIGIAVATDNGLIVPVIHDVDKLSLLGIAREVERLSHDARAGKLKVDDLKGGTFTITSIGNLGGLFASPVINHPEVAILGIGKIVKRPVFNEKGNIRPADMVYLSLGCDHRVLDGAIAIEFGNAIIRRLQKPAELLVKAG
jgi:pyruvate/2-oxoglutarate dehydrogenase complex dihydrolipoamide acyltransferase (E2) component